MITQFDAARQGAVTPAMIRAAQDEKTTPDTVRGEIAAGRAVLPFNPRHSPSKPAVVGRAFRTKVNANIGRSSERSSVSEESDKLRVALDAGADFMMDLSVGPDLSSLRRDLMGSCPVPLGTVPVYEALARAGGDVARLDGKLILDVIGEQAADGVDFMTLHAGLLAAHVPLAARRLLGIVSRGGALLAEWMVLKNQENPLYERWDEVLSVCARHDVTVSLGDGLRPGCLADASDSAQFAELDVLGRLVQSCRAAGVQVMVEGPGHVPFHQIAMNVERQIRVCDGAPFYVLGPVVTDVAPGYDHMVAAIGATAAAAHGAALLCYVTPAEHLALPESDEVREGIMAFRIAAHAGDVARGVAGARDWDDAMSRARRDFDWDGQFRMALDGCRARARYERGRAAGTEADHCSMCGKEFCAMRTTERVRKLLGS
jgi:phosphomethylpyrimidine synthase